MECIKINMKLWANHMESLRNYMESIGFTNPSGIYEVSIRMHMAIIQWSILKIRQTIGNALVRVYKNSTRIHMKMHGKSNRMHMVIIQWSIMNFTKTVRNLL